MGPTLTVRSLATLPRKGVLKSMASCSCPLASLLATEGRGRLYPKVNLVDQPPNKGKRGLRMASTCPVKQQLLIAVFSAGVDSRLLIEGGDSPL